MAQPAYVETWDSAYFPTVDVHSSSLRVPLFNQTPELEWGVATEGMPDAGDEVWLVLSGHALVAKSMVECGGGDNDRASDIKRWLRKARAKRENEKAWRRGREHELTSNPAIARALDDDPEVLFDRAGLTDGERVAMRAWLQPADDGELQSLATVGQKLKIGKDAAKKRIDSALDRISALRSDSTANT